MIRFYNPVVILSGENSTNSLGEEIDKLSPRVHKILVITRGGNFSTTRAAKTLEQALAAYEVHSLEFEKSNPDIIDLFSLVQFVQKYSFDLVVAVGGGSVLDVGKSIASLAGLKIKDQSELQAAIEEKKYLSYTTALPWVGIPTTAGTGSEVTSWATIWHRAVSKKLSLDNPKNFAKIAVIDPQFTVDLPRAITVSSACDAICHATEAYWAFNTNEISQAFSLLAIRNIVGSLEKLLDNPNSLILREKIAKGSTYAGFAFSNTRTTACHSISYPLTMMYGIDHGVAATLSLGEILSFNKNKIKNLNALLEAFQCESIQEVKSWLQYILALGGYSSQLRNYNVPSDELSLIVSRGYTKGRMDNNPRDISESDLLQILKQIY